MGNINKRFALILILIMAVSSLPILVNMPFVLAQSGTSVSGIISEETTWTQANSPILLLDQFSLAMALF